MLTGTNALVTGGGSGLGLACARRLLTDGATVTIAGRTEERLRTAAAALARYARDGADVRWVRCDVRDEAEVAAAVAAAEEGDGLRIVVVSAGTGWLAPLATIPVEAWRHVQETNLTGTFLTLKHAVPLLRRRGGGAVTAITASTRGYGFLTADAASKAGVDELVRSAAVELGRWRIRVNAVQPGPVLTELARSVLEDPEICQDYLDNLPLGRYGTPDEVAAAVRFLSGPEAGWITGVQLPVDGGHRLRRPPTFASYLRAEHGDDWLGGVG